jgi:hypothetical protein
MVVAAGTHRSYDRIIRETIMKIKEHFKRIKERQIFLMFLIMITLAVCLFQTASAAQTVSFASIDGSAERDVYLYNSSGTLLGLYNTTSTGITIPSNESVIFTFKPQTANIISDPGDWLLVAFVYVQTNIIAIILILFFISIILGGR